MSMPEHNNESLDKNFIPKAYTSIIIRLFVQSLRRVSDNPQILDVGPVCGENMMFFGRRVKRLYICDMFSRLHSGCHGDLAHEKIWEILDYPEQCFDGIVLWDLVDRLDKNEIHELVRLCHKFIRPGGSLMLTAYAKQTFLPNVNTFVLGKDYHVSFRPQKHLELYMNYRHNREIMDMFSPLSLAKAQINKSGYREFLLQRDAK